MRPNSPQKLSRCKPTVLYDHAPNVSQKGRQKYRQFAKQLHPKVGFEVLTAVVMNVSFVWDIILCSPLKVLDLKIKATCSSETSVDLQRTT
jgi:hypothetical protein